MASPQSAQGIPGVGDVIAGKFRVERVLGEGGMGLVLEATHLLLDERVALKFLRPQVSLQPEIVARFSQEARAAAKLKSEHVARVLDVGEDRAIPYIVMEYLEGKNLEEVLRERGALSITEAVDLIIQAAEGMSEAHGRGIVHRDLKPANLFLTQRQDGWPTLKILDFGISKAVLPTDLAAVAAGGPGKTLSILGSPYYMSPEQLRSTRDVDLRADIWSLGAVLFELLTNATAFRSTEFIPLVNEILEKPHTPLRDIRSDAPPELEALVDRALAKDPADRFKSAGELALALLSFTTSKRSRVIATHAISMTRSSGIDPGLPLPSALPPGISSGSVVSARPASAPRVPSIPSGEAAPPTASRSSGSARAFESGPYRPASASDPVLAVTALAEPNELPRGSTGSSNAISASMGDIDPRPVKKRATVPAAAALLAIGVLAVVAVVAVGALFAMRSPGAAVAAPVPPSVVATPTEKAAGTAVLASPLASSAEGTPARSTVSAMETDASAGIAIAGTGAGASTASTDTAKHVVPPTRPRAATSGKLAAPPASSAGAPPPPPAEDLDIRRAR